MTQQGNIFIFSDQRGFTTVQKLYQHYRYRFICSLVAALVGREVSALPEQRDTPRPHHKVSASPAQEEETPQHQRAVPGQCCRRPLLENQWITTTLVTQQQPIKIMTRIYGHLTQEVKSEHKVKHADFRLKDADLTTIIIKTIYYTTYTWIKT